MGAGEEILRSLAELHAKVDRLLAGGATSGVQAASDSELDSQYGDEEIKKDPPRWKGDESFAGKRMSECSPAFLECFAEFKLYCAERDAEKAAQLAAAGDPETEKKAKYVAYGRKSAARALGWKRRIEGGWKRPTPNPEGW